MFLLIVKPTYRVITGEASNKICAGRIRVRCVIIACCFGLTTILVGCAMPIYDYQCSDCGHRADVLRKLSDPALTTCPVCGKDTFVKQLSAAGFQLKGGGWYATDFKGGNATTTPASPAATSTDAAPATTPAAGCGSGACGHTH